MSARLVVILVAVTAMSAAAFYEVSSESGLGVTLV